MHLAKTMGPDSLSGKAPSVALPKGQRGHRDEEQALCARQKWHT